MTIRGYESIFERTTEYLGSNGKTILATGVAILAGYCLLSALSGPTTNAGARQAQKTSTLVEKVGALSEALK